MLLQDGKGRGFAAGVNSRNELLNHATISSEINEVAKEDGQAYSFPTDVVAIAAAGQDGLLYILNPTTSRKDLQIDDIRVSSDAEAHWRFYKNPTGGTLISGADGTPVNTNFGSGNQFTGTFKVGVDGNTVTGGDLFGQLISLSGPFNFDSQGSIILTPGQSLAVEVESFAANNVGCTVLGFFGRETNGN
jgi:hypothetical protein